MVVDYHGDLKSTKYIGFPGDMFSCKPWVWHNHCIPLDGGVSRPNWKKMPLTLRFACSVVGKKSQTYSPNDGWKIVIYHNRIRKQITWNKHKKIKLDRVFTDGVCNCLKIFQPLLTTMQYTWKVDGNMSLHIFCLFSDPLLTYLPFGMGKPSILTLRKSPHQSHTNLSPSLPTAANLLEEVVWVKAKAFFKVKEAMKTKMESLKTHPRRFFFVRET